MSFTVEGTMTLPQPVDSQPVNSQQSDIQSVEPTVGQPRDEVDASMYTSASENESQFEEILKLESEKKELEQELEQLKLHNAQLVSSSETLEKKVAALSEEKLAETERLEQQLKYLTDQQNESQRIVMEERLSTSSKFEEKEKEIDKLKTSVETLQQELLQCRQQAVEKDKLLHDEQTESKRKLVEQNLSISTKYEEKDKQIEKLKTDMEILQQELVQYKQEVEEKDKILYDQQTENERKVLEERLTNLNKFEEKDKQIEGLKKSIGTLQQELLQCRQNVEEKDKLLNDLQTESERKVVEERLTNSSKFEEKNKEIEILRKSVENLQQQLQQCIQNFHDTEKEQKLKIENQKSNMLKQQKKLDSLQQELFQYKESIEEKDKLLHEQVLKIDDQSSKITQLQEEQQNDAKLKDGLLDSKGKDIRELTKKLQSSAEEIAAEKLHRQKLDMEKQKLEETISQLEQELHLFKTDNEELKSKFNTNELELRKYKTQMAEELHQMQSSHQEKSETLEKELSQKLEETKSENTSLRKSKEQLNFEIKKLNSEISAKNTKLSELSLAVVNSENKLKDCAKQHQLKESTFLAEKEKMAAEIKELQETVDKKAQDETLMKTIFENQIADRERKLDELKTVHGNLEKELEEETSKLAAENKAMLLKLQEHEENYKKAVQAEAEAVKEISKCKSDSVLEKEYNDKEVKKLNAIIIEKDKMIEQQKASLGKECVSVGTHACCILIIAHF